MSIVGLIPARGSSKGVPRKNLRPLHGVPLIAWTIQTALASGVFDRIIVTTDDPEIAEVSLEYGAEIPFIRPAELATDQTPGILPVLHALDQLPGVEEVMLLQPTSPLRTTHDIQGILTKYRDAGAQCAISVTRNHQHPEWAFQMSSRGYFLVPDNFVLASNRQHLPATYAINGAMYLAECSWLRSRRTFITPSTLMYEMPQERSLDIDSEFDLKLATLLLHGKLAPAISTNNDSIAKN